MEIAQQLHHNLFTSRYSCIGPRLLPEFRTAPSWLFNAMTKKREARRYRRLQQSLTERHKTLIQGHGLVCDNGRKKMVTGGLYLPTSSSYLCLAHFHEDIISHYCCHTSVHFNNSEDVHTIGKQCIALSIFHGIKYGSMASDILRSCWKTALKQCQQQYSKLLCWLFRKNSI